MAHIRRERGNPPHNIKLTSHRTRRRQRIPHQLRAQAGRLLTLIAITVLTAGILVGALAPRNAWSAQAGDPTIRLSTKRDMWADSSCPWMSGDLAGRGTEGYTGFATAWIVEGSDAVAYCNENPDRTAPNDGEWLTYTRGDHADKQVSYILDHGYPNTTTIAGNALSAKDARLVTSFALWIYHGTDLASDNPTSRRMYQIAKTLSDEAVARATQTQTGTYWVYNQPTGTAYQKVVIAERAVTVTFNKVSANAQITTNNGAYAYAGATYEIHRAQDNALVATITTDNAGHASLTLQPNERYYAVETQAPAGFVKNPEHIAFETGSGDSSVDLPDEPGTFSLILRKRDAATGGAAQAGLTLAGATYSVVDANGTTHTLTTDQNGRASVTGLPLGTITVRETKAPAGYRLDTQTYRYTVGADRLTAQGTFELVPEDDFAEIPIACDLEVAKFLDEGADTSGVRPGAEGVSFIITALSTGKDVGTITTDASGYASTRGRWFGTGSRPEGASGALPYDPEGYRVREDPATTPAGWRAAPAWTISVDELADGATLHYIVENNRIESRLQVVKEDAATGATVPLAGFSFQLLDSAKRPITQEVWYPTPVEQDTFTTDASGTVTLPQPLTPGTYYLREVAAAKPYTITHDDVRVVIEDRDDVPALTVVRMRDERARGKARIVKRCTAGDACSSTLEGARFAVIAQENVVAPNGTVEAVQGETVATVTTDKRGAATTPELPLGTGTARYAFVEIAAPAGHILDQTPIPFTLSYADDETPVVTCEVEAVDQPTRIRLDKTVLGYGDPLEGATFDLWRAEDEIALEPQAGCAALAVDAPAGSTVRMQPVVASAEIAAEVADGFQLELVDASGKSTDVDKTAHLTAGTYTLRVRDADGVICEAKGDTSIEVEDGMRYRIAVSNSIFTGLSVTTQQDGPRVPAIEITWDRDLGIYRSCTLDAGTYMLMVDDASAGTLEVAEDQGYAVTVSTIGQDNELQLKRVPALLKPGCTASSHTTGADGILTIDHLTAGSYRLWESQAPDGFIEDGEVRLFTVSSDGRTEGFETFELEAENDFTKIDISKRDITGEQEIPGAHLEVRTQDGAVIDSWVSSDEDHRIEALAPGRYTLVETMTPHTYDQAKEVSFTVEKTGTVQRVVMHDEPIEITAEIDKRQEIADPVHEGCEADALEQEGGSNRAPVTVSDEGAFCYSVDARNTSSTWVDEFTVTDELTGVEAKLAELTGIVTPEATGDYDGRMNVWFKTDGAKETDGTAKSEANATLDDGHENPWLTHESTREALGDDGRVLDYTGWQLWQRSVPTDEATELSVADLDLKEGERIVAVRLEYGRVEEDFTTRSEDWDRDDLKHVHDDVADVVTPHDENGHAPLVLRMRLTDAYQTGIVLENEARVDAYRNGGDTQPDEHLEDHDEDKVAQTPDDTPESTPPLAKTGRGGSITPLLAGATVLGGGAWLLARRAMRRASSRGRRISRGSIQRTSYPSDTPRMRRVR